jgi:hypothetical protein
MNPLSNGKTALSKILPGLFRAINIKAIALFILPVTLIQGELLKAGYHPELLK